MLYTHQANPTAALNIYLDLHLPLSFDYAAQYNCIGLLGTRAADVLEIDEEKGLAVLVAHYEEAAAAEVVASVLQAAQQAQQGGVVHGTKPGEKDGSDDKWRRRLYGYLDRLYKVDANAAAPFADLQVRCSFIGGLGFKL